MRSSGCSCVKANASSWFGSRRRSTSCAITFHPSPRIISAGSSVGSSVLRDALGLRERLADERERRRQRDPVLQREPLQVGETLARLDVGERTPVVARQLAAQVVHEARFVRLHRRQRERDDQVGDVVRAVLRDREQEQRERGARVVVEAPDQAEVEQREAAVRREEARCRDAGRRGRRPSTVTWRM